MHISTVGVPTFGSFFGAYNGSIFYQNVTCSDSYNCTALNATDSACNSTRIAGVMCVYGKGLFTLRYPDFIKVS